MGGSIDYAAEGLLEGLDSDSRAARIELLDELIEAGAELDELRAAVAEGRLALLPVERLLSGSERYTPDEVAELTGVPREQLDRQWQALGMALSDTDGGRSASRAPTISRPPGGSVPSSTPVSTPMPWSRWPA